jgi:transposase
MNLHANAALSLNKRRQLCQRVADEAWTVSNAAEAAEVSVRCARKWVGRYRAEGELGLLDRSSAPKSIPHRTSEERVQAIAALRRLRFTGPEIAEILDMALSTVSGVLTRIGMGRLGRLGLEPAKRYERANPGELVHIDVKKLGKIKGGAGHRMTGRRPTAKPERCGPESWRHEIAHPISPARGRRPADLAVADALLTYLQTGEDGSLALHQRWIELDRGTARPAEQLAAKITSYTKLRYYTPPGGTQDATSEPLWRNYYRSWPHLLIVLADQSRERMRLRIQRTLVLHESDPTDGHTGAIPISFVGLKT